MRLFLLKNYKIMNITLVSLSDFRKNQKRYIGLAKNEKVFVTQRGTDDVIELVIRNKQQLKISNLDRAIPLSELLVGVKEDLSEIFNEANK